MKIVLEFAGKTTQLVFVDWKLSRKHASVAEFRGASSYELRRKEHRLSDLSSTGWPAA